MKKRGVIGSPTTGAILQQTTGTVTTPALNIAVLGDSLTDETSSVTGEVGIRPWWSMLQKIQPNWNIEVFANFGSALIKNDDADGVTATLETGSGNGGELVANAEASATTFDIVLNFLHTNNLTIGAGQTAAGKATQIEEGFALVDSTITSGTKYHMSSAGLNIGTVINSAEKIAADSVSSELQSRGAYDIDFFSTTPLDGFLLADGLHLTQPGHDYIAYFVRNRLVELEGL